MRYFLLGLIGLSGGLIISAGVFALIVSTGLMSRLAGKTHTGKHVRIYEDAVVFGGAIFNALYVSQVSYIFSENIAKWVMGVGALFSGIFIGCLAVSLAEALKSTTIFGRRMKLSTGLSFIVLSAGIGKLAGALLQFFVL